jgi:hypothetical protein
MGAIHNTEEAEAEKFTHIHIPTDYLHDPPPAYTRYQVFVRRLRQVEDETGVLYVLHPSPPHKEMLQNNLTYTPYRNSQ